MGAIILQCNIAKNSRLMTHLLSRDSLDSLKERSCPVLSRDSWEFLMVSENFLLACISLSNNEKHIFMVRSSAVILQTKIWKRVITKIQNSSLDCLLLSCCIFIFNEHCNKAQNRTSFLIVIFFFFFFFLFISSMLRRLSISLSFFYR